jgi:hypothetical protein
MEADDLGVPLVHLRWPRADVSFAAGENTAAFREDGDAEREAARVMLRDVRLVDDPLAAKP